MIHVIATIEVVPGKRDALLQEFHQLVPKVRAEQGCIEYGPAVDAPTSIQGQAPLRENTLVMMEKWESVAALEAHLKIQHTVDFLARVKDLVSNLRLEILQPA